VRGLMSYVRTVVAEPDTMTVMGTGDLEVLAIPRLLALADQAAVDAIAPSMEPGMTSVDASAAVEYKLPSPIGAEVVVWAELTGVSGRRLSFSLTAVRSGSRSCRWPGTVSQWGTRCIPAGSPVRGQGWGHCSPASWYRPRLRRMRGLAARCGRAGTRSLTGK